MVQVTTLLTRAAFGRVLRETKELREGTVVTEKLLISQGASR